jgi:hypothetical protein
MTESEVRSKCTKFSIKNFVADLPRMLNEAFGTICDCIFSFYDADNGDIHLKNIAKLEASYIDATTVVAQNLRFKGSDGTMYNYNDIGSILEKIEKKINSISNISKSQIDSLDVYPFQPWPLYADFYMIRPTNPDPGCKVLSEFGLTIWDEDPETHEYEWFDTPVEDGVTYLCGSDLHIYKRDKETSRWIDLGSYKNN